MSFLRDFSQAYAKPNRIPDHGRMTFIEKKFKKRKKVKGRLDIWKLDGHGYLRMLPKSFDKMFRKSGWILNIQCVSLRVFCVSTCFFLYTHAYLINTNYTNKMQRQYA